MPVYYNEFEPYPAQWVQITMKDPALQVNSSFDQEVYGMSGKAPIPFLAIGNLLESDMSQVSCVLAYAQFPKLCAPRMPRNTWGREGSIDKILKYCCQASILIWFGPDKSSPFAVGAHGMFSWILRWKFDGKHLNKSIYFLGLWILEMMFYKLDRYVHLQARMKNWICDTAPYIGQSSIFSHNLSLPFRGRTGRRWDELSSIYSTYLWGVVNEKVELL